MADQRLRTNWIEEQSEGRDEEVQADLPKLLDQDSEARPQVGRRLERMGPLPDHYELSPEVGDLGMKISKLEAEIDVQKSRQEAANACQGQLNQKLEDVRRELRRVMLKEAPEITGAMKI